jgi:hypothetical protein
VRRALVVGIDHYDRFDDIDGCEADAAAMAELLGCHEGGSRNFECRVLTSASDRITRASLRQSWIELFDSFRGDIAFYFSGHGAPTTLGGYLVTQDGTPEELGLPMDELVNLANKSAAASVLVVLDCCFAGSLGNPASLQGDIDNKALLREGVTLLAASRPTQVAYQAGGHGVFTQLLIGALKGGAADVRGKVSAASMYAYAEAALGAWSQRPMYKSHASSLSPVRQCEPRVTDAVLRELPDLFDLPDAAFPLDPTFEETSPAATPAHVAVFKKFKRLQIAGLLRPRHGDDLYWSAERSGSVVLTQLGQFYWHLAKDKQV